MIFGKKKNSKTIRLPETFSKKEMDFIENWYSETGMQQLLSAKNRPCEVLSTKPPVKGCKYVDVSEIPVLVRLRDPKTLMGINKTELKTVKLLLLNEWIN